MDQNPEWTTSVQPCAVCGMTVPLVNIEDDTCPLCWAARTGSDPDHALGQAIAVEALLLVDTAPDRVADCVARLRRLSDHATRPAVTAVLSEAARDLEFLATESGRSGDW
jgi:hypothetical protein